MSQTARGLSAIFVAGSILFAVTPARSADPIAIADELVAMVVGTSTTRTATYQAAEGDDIVTITGFSVEDDVNSTHAFVAEIIVTNAVEQEDGGFVADAIRLVDGSLSDEVNFLFWDVIELDDIVIPPLADLGAEDGPVIPLTGGLLEQLMFDVPEGEDLVVAGVTFEIDEIVEDQPYSVTATVNGLELPVSLAGESDLTSIIRQMGYDVLVMDLALAGTFDADADTLLADEVTVNIQEIGRVDITGAFIGLPLGMLQEPGGLDELLASAKVESINIRFENAGAMETFMRVQAELMGIPPEEAAGALAVVFQLLLGTFEDPTLAQRVGVPVGAFLRNPQTITIAATLDEPLELPIIIDTLLRAPELLFSLLDVVVTANE
jgi:hypothetical protein